jgi:integrase
VPRDPERRSHGEGSVSWDASVGRWVGRLPRDEHGRREKVSGTTRRQVERKLERLLAEREQGITGAGRMTVKAFLEQWIRDTVMVSDRSPATKAKHEIAVRVHLVPGLGRVQLAKLTPMRVQRFLRDELAAGKGRPTVKQELVTLRMALKQAVVWGLLPRNVAALVDGVADRPTERRPFTPDEQRRILDAARGDRLYVMVVLAHATGLRQSELLGVRWTDLDLNARVLRFTTQYGRDGVLREPKTAAGHRVLPLPQSTIDVLLAHREQQDRERAAATNWEDWGLVIATRNGRPVNHHNARRSWNRILHKAGVDHRGIHHMRHAYVTMLAEQGVHERVAQQLAGHADARMTREIYTHVTAPMFDKAANAIAQAVDDTFGSSDDAIGSRNGSSTGEPPARSDDPTTATSP